MQVAKAKLFFLSFAVSLAAAAAGLLFLVGRLPAQAASADVLINADVSVLCGNNIREGSETCDGGASSGVCYNSSCNSDCTCPVCGDGTIGAGEGCESTSDCPAGQTCNASCVCAVPGHGPPSPPPPACTVSCDPWGACSSGIQSRSCTNSCSGPFTQTQSCLPVCGNGFTEAGEECDDNNTAAGDGCSSSCQLELGCGNGVVEAGEECDDNNTAAGDCCSSSCQVELLISNVSVSSVTRSSATVNWLTRSWQGGTCSSVATGSVLEWGRTVSLSDGSASLSGSSYRHPIGGLTANTSYYFQITASLDRPAAPDLVTSYDGSWLTSGGVENCNNGLDDDHDGFCDYAASTCTDGSVAGDPNCACAPDFLCAPGACQPDGLRVVTCEDQTTPTCQPGYQYQEGCGVCTGVVCGGCQQLDPQTCSCIDVANCCGNQSCEPPGEDPYRCALDCPVSCLSEWDCGGWQPADCPAAGVQTRDCFDRNACAVPIIEPDTQRSCGGVCPGLECGAGEIINITQCVCERIVPFCGNAVCEAGESLSACPQDCVEICEPSWTCLGWGSCQAGSQSRECYDLNGCDLDLGRPPEVRSCQPGCDVACGVCQSLDLASCSCAPTVECCGNRICEEDEATWSCAVDCGIPPTVSRPLPACLDGLDNDRDGLPDYLADPGCAKPSDRSERNITESAGAIGTLFREAVLDNLIVETINEQLAAPLLMTAVVVNSFSMLPLFTFLSFLRFLVTEPFALRLRRRKQWGVVYNAITKEPIDLAIVRLYRTADNRPIRSQVTDQQGRYSFIVPPGRYYLTVTKPTFTFPTALLKGKYEDVRHLNLYHGEPIEIQRSSLPITANIPLDSPEDSRQPAKLIFQYFRRKLQYAIAFSGVPLAALSLAISPSGITLSLFGVHCLLYGLFRRLAYVRPAKSWGVVYDQANRTPIRLAVVRIYDQEHHRLVESRITDRHGRYAFLVDHNWYYLTAEKPGYRPRRTGDLNLIEKGRAGIVNFDINLERGTGPSLPPPPPSVPTQSPPPVAPPPASEVGRQSLEDIMKLKPPASF